MARHFAQSSSMPSKGKMRRVKLALVALTFAAGGALTATSQADPALCASVSYSLLDGQDHSVVNDCYVPTPFPTDIEMWHCSTDESPNVCFYLGVMAP